jgi:hypothetical protein
MWDSKLGLEPADLEKTIYDALGRVCKVRNLTVGAKHLYLDVWLKPEFCVQMLRPH